LQGAAQVTRLADSGAQVRHLKLAVEALLGEAQLTALADALAALPLSSLDISVQDYQPAPSLPALLAQLETPALTRLYVWIDGEGEGDANARAIAGNAGLAALRTLELSGDIRAAGVSALANSPHMANLEALELYDCAPGERGVTALAQSPYITRLRRLELRECEITARRLAILCASDRMAALEHLDLSSNNIGPAGALALANSPHLSGLKTLRLDGPGAGEQIAALWEGPGLRALETLELYRVSMSARCASRIARAAWPPALSALALGYLTLTGPAARALASAPGLAVLRALQLVDCTIRDPAALASSPHLSALRRVESWGSALGDAACAALVGGPSAATLESLDLIESGAGDLTMWALAGCARLEQLRCDEGAISAASASALARLPASLRVLSLRQNPIGAAGAAALASAPRPALRTLDLAGCEIGDAGLVALAEGANLEGLERLWLEGNGIGPAGIAALAASGWAQGLRVLAVARNPLGDEGVAALARSGLIEQLRYDPERNEPRDGDLTGAGMSARGLMAVMDALATTSLDALVLSDETLRDEDIAQLAAHPALARLVELDLWGLELSAAGVRAIAQSPYAAGLRYLNFSGQDEASHEEIVASPHLCAAIRAYAAASLAQIRGAGG
jgi:hypothetical protein